MPEHTGDAARTSTRSGPGRLLVAVYAVLAVSATCRALVQLLSKGDEAPLAYGLSLLAGLVYCVATLALARGGEWWRRIAWATISAELVGVLAVGLLSLADEDLFPDDTVWSRFGQGYGFVPLVLPVLGLLWLQRTGEERRS
uniref:Integral membrane protein n=1 Tax=uncultured Nocardioidaceae bacterium TaxID=253824 RepID=A0A6J4KVS9_9ACTN|nr:MAG: Integral membrane protein [uncultured Nocardioidaceae bacterium]